MPYDPPRPCLCSAGNLIGSHYCSPPLEPQMLRQVPLRTLRFPMLNSKNPLCLFLLPQIRSSTGGRNLTEWHATNLVLLVNGRCRSGKFMISPERSQRPSTSLTLSRWKHYVGPVVVWNLPASGFPEFSRVESPWRLSFVVSSSPRSRVWTSEEASSLLWRMMVFCRWPRMGSNAVFARLVKGSGGRTRRTQCVIYGNSTLGWLISASPGASSIMP